MSYHTWSVEGYGYCADDIYYRMRDNNILDDDTECLSRLNQVISKAPIFKKEFDEWCKETFDDELPLTFENICTEWEDDNCYGGLASILHEVINEWTNINYVLCDDFNCCRYILYCPIYPWWKCSKEELNATEESVATQLNELAKIMCGEEIGVDYQSVENGG